MPYDSISDAEKKNPGLKKYSDKAKRGWLSALNSCLKDGKDESKCFAIAYSVANKIRKNASVKQADLAQLSDIQRRAVPAVVRNLARDIQERVKKLAVDYAKENPDPDGKADNDIINFFYRETLNKTVDILREKAIQKVASDKQIAQELLRVAKDLSAVKDYEYKYDPQHKQRPHGGGWVKTEEGWSKGKTQEESLGECKRCGEKAVDKCEHCGDPVCEDCGTYNEHSGRYICRDCINNLAIQRAEGQADE